MKVSSVFGDVVLLSELHVLIAVALVFRRRSSSLVTILCSRWLCLTREGATAKYLGETALGYGSSFSILRMLIGDGPHLAKSSKSFLIHMELIS